MKISANSSSVRDRREADLAAASSGYGSYGGGHDTTYCPEGVPVETALLAILGAFAAAFGLLFTTITMITMGRRRKKRQVSLSQESPPNLINDLLWLGMSLDYYRTQFDPSRPVVK